MTKRMIIMLVAVGVLFGGLFGFKAFLGGAIKKSISAQGVPPQTVSTAKAQFTEWQGEVQAVGTRRAGRRAEVAPNLPARSPPYTSKRARPFQPGHLTVTSHTDWS